MSREPDIYQRLFFHMYYRHGLVLTDSEMEELIDVVNNPFEEELMPDMI